MFGNGVDMYDLIPEIHDENDIHLVRMPEQIWIGVIEKLNPSPPVPRKKTTCFSKRPVYMYRGRRIFSMVHDHSTGMYDFYYIPDEELFFIEKVVA